MSDIPTTHKIPDPLLGKLLHLSRAPTLYAPACEEAAAEITRLRADLAAAQEREQRMREALDSIAAWDDHGANRALERDGTYGRFDEPGSVQIARAALGEP